MTPAALQALLEGDLENFLAASTPGGIEAQEKQGQMDMVNAGIPYLPKKLNSGPFDASKSAAEKYEEIGIKILGDYDDEFYLVKLPDGWKLKANEDNSFWSILHDEKGKQRAKIFYKAAFYDRRAHVWFEEEEYIR
jgi:hypothetical protein